jgi:hypothetical protein
LNYYELLGVAEDAPREQIRATYRVRVAAVHPDVNAASDAEAETALLNEAWSVLREPATRAAYDAAGLATSAALRCQRCALATPELRFVVFARVQGGRPRNEGMLVCPGCRRTEARAAALASVARGRYAARRDRRVTLGAIARDVRGGKVERHTTAALLRQIGFGYAREGRSGEALTALEAVLEFGDDPAVARVVARLREAGGRPAAPAAPPASPAVSRERGPQWPFAGMRGLAPGAASVAALLIIAATLGWFGFRSHAATTGAAMPPVELARNVDPALRDDAARLAGIVRPQPVPPGQTYLFELAADKAFALAYESAVATLPEADRERHPWLVTLETTSQPSEAVEMPRSDDYVLARGCDPRTCDDGFVSIAYNAATHAVAGAAYFAERWHPFGSNALPDRAMVMLAVAGNRLPLERRFALEPAREAELHRFIESI